MRPVGALLVLLGGGRQAYLARGQAALNRAHNFHGTARVRLLDRAIDAFSQLRNARRTDGEATAFLATALLEKTCVVPLADRPALRARAVAALQHDLPRLEGRPGDLAYALATLLSAAWDLQPDEPQDSPEALSRLTRARDAQARALAACPPGHAGLLSARLQLAACEVRLAEHPLCQDRPAQCHRLAGLLPDLAAAVSRLPPQTDGAAPDEAALLQMVQGRCDQVCAVADPYS